MFQYSGANYYIPAFGNIAYIFPGAGISDSVVANVWDLQVINGSGEALAGNFEVSEDITLISNRSNVFDGLFDGHWTTNSSGSFLDNVGFFNPSGFEVQTALQGFFVDGAQVSTLFSQGRMFYNGSLVYGAPSVINP